MKRIFCLLLVASYLSACEPYHFYDTASISLKKDPCFGICPVYDFQVDGKGNAVFNGIRNVSKEGKWTRKLDPTTTNQLFYAFQNSDFDHFKDEYTAQITDQPATWVGFVNGATKKTVKDYYGAPEALKILEKMVEAIAEEDKEWIRSNDQ